MQKQNGFTLIELIVVMIILGVLASTALPKFMDVTGKSHEAAVAGVGGSFGTAAALVHAQWIANGHTSAIDNLVGFGDSDIDTNAAGWPTDTAGSNDVASANHCMAIWNGLMQGPPSVASSGTSTDYVVSANNANNTCTFTYIPVANMSIGYDADTGVITVDSSS